MASSSFFFPSREIVPRVWVGNRVDAHDPAFMQRHNIRHVINCTKDVSFKFQRLNGFRIPVHDDPAENATMLFNLPIAVDAIESALAFGEGAVLIHCHAGMQRSAAVCAAYLMRRHKWTVAQAMAFMQRVKPEVFKPYPTFAKALTEFYETVKPMN